jgi:glycosyltransferase 2 family protein
VSIARPLVGLAVSLGLLWFLFHGTDVHELADILGRVSYPMLAPAIAVYFGGVWLRGLRWGLLLAPVARLSPGALFRATVIGFTVNDLAPIRLGELARALLLARWHSVPIAATLGTILVERLFDGLTLCGILALAWLWMPLGSWLQGVTLLAGMVFVGALLVSTAAAFAPSLVLRVAGVFARPLPRSLASRVLGLVETFLEGLVVLRRGRILVSVVGLSLLAWLAEATMYYIIMRGFGFDAGAIASLLGMVAANLGTMVPSSPGFVGTFDVPLRFVLVDRFAVDPNLATSYTLVVHLALLLPVVLLGLALLWREGLSLRDLGRGAGGIGGSPRRSTDGAARAL